MKCFYQVIVSNQKKLDVCSFNLTLLKIILNSLKILQKVLLITILSCSIIIQYFWDILIIKCYITTANKFDNNRVDIDSQANIHKTNYFHVLSLKRIFITFVY